MGEVIFGPAEGGGDEKVFQPVGDWSTPQPTVVGAFFQGMWDGVHNALDIAGLIPGVGEIADAANGLIYLAEGDKTNAGLSFAATIPFVGWGATGGKALKKGADAIAEGVAEQTVKQADEVVDAGTTGIKNGTETAKEIAEDIRYTRPSGFRKGIRNEVYDNAREVSTGVPRDPQTGRFIGQNEPWDMGHKPGYEFEKHQKSAQKRNIDRDKFLDEHNDSSHYRPELPSSNRNHKSEGSRDLDYWP